MRQATLERRPSRHRERFLPRNRIARHFTPADEASRLREVYDDRDQQWQELVARIARGERIRGHAL